MLIGADTKLLVVHRRLFPGDDSRYFVGTVEGYENGVAKIRGHTWNRDQYGNLKLKSDERTKILALSSGTLIVYQLPLTCDVKKVELHVRSEGSVWLSDGNDLDMDLSEKPSP